MLNEGVRLILIVTSLLLTAFPCKSQISVTQAKDLAESSKCVSNSALSKPKFLRSIRSEEFEDYIFSLQKKDYGNLAKSAFVFIVDETGIYITDSNEIINVTSTGDSPKIIAVLKNSGKVLGLFGCKDPIDDFQTLITDARIILTSNSDALSVGYLYYRLVKDPNLKRIVYKSREFRHEVENYFFDHFPESKATTKFRKWEKSFDKFKRNAKFGITTTKQNDEYLVSITFFSKNVNELPFLQNEVLSVDPNGAIKLLRTSTVFK